MLVTEEGKELGEITDITPARTDIYTVRMGEREVMFPSADGVVVEVDAEGGKITVNEVRLKKGALL